MLSQMFLFFIFGQIQKNSKAWVKQLPGSLFFIHFQVDIYSGVLSMDAVDAISKISKHLEYSHTESKNLMLNLKNNEKFYVAVRIRWNLQKGAVNKIKFKNLRVLFWTVSPSWKVTARHWYIPYIEKY